MRKTFIILAVLISFLGCQKSAQDVPVMVLPDENLPSGPGFAFRLASTTLDSLADYDTAIADIQYLDGDKRKVKRSLVDVFKGDLGVIEFDGLPLKDCRIDAEFQSKHAQGKMTHVIQIHVSHDSDSVSNRSCTDDRILVDGSVQESGDLILKPWQDAWIGPRDNEGNNNNGVGSELRIWEGGSLGLLDFGDFTALLSGRTIEKAELVLHGWKGVPGVGDTTSDLSIDLGTIPRGWSEGNGNWYWFDQGPHNNFERAYIHWPHFLPPSCSHNPASASGIRWSVDGGVREGFQKISTFIPELDDVSYSYPTQAQAKVIRLDVTESVKSQWTAGHSLGFGLRRATSSLAPHESIAFFSKDHAPSVSPTLVIQFAK